MARTTKTARSRAARERKRRRLIREAEALERKFAAIQASLVSKGEMREVLENVDRRLLAWWSGGDEQTGLTVIADTLGLPRAALELATVADLVSAADVSLREGGRRCSPCSRRTRRSIRSPGARSCRKADRCALEDPPERNARRPPRRLK